MSDYVFEFVGGRLCLDFVNTLGERVEDPPSEHLTEYAELVRWARDAGAIDQGSAKALVREARDRPRAAHQVLLRARRVREAIYRVFTAAREQEPPAVADVDLVNRELGSALANTRINAGDDGAFELAWSDATALDRPLWPVLRSAAELLATGELARLKACASDSCEWVFMDESRNRSRQWCQMEVCGNRAKARRHYALTRSRRTGAGKTRGKVERS